MGATGITVVAVAQIAHMTGAPVVTDIRGLLAGASIMFWVFGTWLIPPLVAAGWWRHVTHRIPVRYDPTWWSVVFPLGMYGVGGYYLGQAGHLPIVQSFSADEGWVALAAWALAFLAMPRATVTMHASSSAALRRRESISRLVAALLLITMGRVSQAWRQAPVKET